MSLLYAKNLKIGLNFSIKNHQKLAKFLFLKKLPETKIFCQIFKIGARKKSQLFRQSCVGAAAAAPKIFFPTRSIPLQIQNSFLAEDRERFPAEPQGPALVRVRRSGGIGVRPARPHLAGVPALPEADVRGVLGMSQGANVKGNESGTDKNKYTCSKSQFRVHFAYFS